MDENGNAVEGNRTPTDNYTSLIFTPVLPFKPGKIFTVTIDKSMMDLSGVTMAIGMKWSFKTKE